MFKKLMVVILVLSITMGIVYVMGPKVKPARLDTKIQQPLTIAQIEQKVSTDAIRPNIKPGNASTIVWADSTTKAKTPFSVVYLHGFSASPVEGAPLHDDFADRYGFNLYKPLLFSHGLEVKEPMADFTAEGFLASAKDAISVGKTLGDQVIVIGCSTGGTAGLYLASVQEDIAALILISPNVYLANPASVLISGPWGKEILEQILGSQYQSWDATDEVKKYWYTKYRYEALVELMRLLDATMLPEVFKQIIQPVFTGYYYKNDDEQDDVVSVSSMLKMHEQISTPLNKKRKVAFPNANTHVISSPLMNPNYQEVIDEVFKYADEVLELKPINSDESSVELQQTL